jgi:hypothetical protein
MLRHFQLFAPAPGREVEAERALIQWLEQVRGVEEFRGGFVLREYAGEFGEVVGALAVMYDVESREAGAAFRKATADIRNPMAQDVPGDEPADQGIVLFQSAHGHAHGAERAAHDDHGGGHGHEHPDTGSPATSLGYDRGGRLLARLMHGHFTIVASGSPSTAPSPGLETGP